MGLPILHYTVTTDPADPRRSEPRSYWAQNYSINFFNENFTELFSCLRALRWVN